MDFRDVAIKAVKESGKVLNENFGHVKGIRIKMGDWRELVTDVDMKANDIIIQMLKENFPDHGIVSEESKPIKGNDYRWYVDPLDGTTNYTLGIPFSATCVSLVLRGNPILGVVFNPMMNELFIGEEGKGATLNGEKIRVSDNDDLKATVVNYCHLNHNNQGIEIMKGFFDYFKENARDYRRLGSGALDLCWVACGRNDVYVRPDLSIYDIVPGYVIAKEAGAKTTDWQNRPWTLESKDLLATNGTKIHEEVLGIINRSK